MVGTEAAGDSLERALQSAELERARLENEKLKIELDELKNRSGKLLSGLTNYMIPIVTTLLAIAGFWWGIFQYQGEQQKNRDAQKEQADREQAAADREFMKPWLESQWDNYMAALSAATTLANSEDPVKVKQATDEFWALYQGKMILVETKEVSGAMVKFGRCLDGTETCDKQKKNERTRELGTVMAKSLAATAAMTYAQFTENQFKYTSSQ